jgi:hypothetical protein
VGHWMPAWSVTSSIIKVTRVMLIWTAHHSHTSFREGIKSIMVYGP